MGAIRTIKLLGDKFAAYRMAVELEGRVFFLDITYNSWVHGSFMQISDANETVLVSSVPLVMGVVLLQQYNYMAELPPGKLFLYNRNNFNNVPRPSGEVVLAYEESA